MKKQCFFVMLVFVCAALSAHGADGFGEATTGGAGGTVISVDNAADLEYYAELSTDPTIIEISGSLNIDDTLEIRSNKTLRGVDSNATLIGQVGFRNRDSNIIIERLNITNPNDAGDGDGINLTQDITNVFITRCTFYDCMDGCLDISNRSDLITISWCKFYYTHDNEHNFVNLIGSRDSATDDAGHLRVTMHHNWYTTGCKERMPRVRYGQVHVYNNYYGDLTEGGYCVGVGVSSHIRVEDNYFDAVWMPWKDYYTGTGYADGEIGWNDGNVFNDCSVPTWAANAYSTIFTLPYTYTPDDASMIPVIVQWGAGADGRDGYPPHWAFGPYGDFDLSGFVDVNDLGTFADYWLDVTGIDDADYDGSGRVDMGEFSLFSGNYRYIPPDTTAPAAPVNLSSAAGDGVVNLDWDDNGEADLAGYNVYRSGTSSSGYVKLNSSCLTGSSYTDDTATNEVPYYYVVTAVDTSSNESGYSGEVSAIALPADVIILQENEFGFCHVDGIVDLSGEHAGYTAAGYCDTENATGSGIDWSIHVTTADTYTLVWRYANGSTDRPARLLINGVEAVASLSFPATGAWENWATVSVSVPLTAGTKTVRLEATGDSGCANIDYLKIEGAGVEATACP